MSLFELRIMNEDLRFGPDKNFRMAILLSSFLTLHSSLYTLKVLS